MVIPDYEIHGLRAEIPESVRLPGRPRRGRRPRRGATPRPITPSRPITPIRPITPSKPEKIKGLDGVTRTIGEELALVADGNEPSYGILDSSYE
jgi:hypothetical protein